MGMGSPLHPTRELGERRELPLGPRAEPRSKPNLVNFICHRTHLVGKIVCLLMTMLAQINHIFVHIIYHNNEIIILS